MKLASTDLRTFKASVAPNGNLDFFSLANRSSLCTLQLARFYLDQPSNRLQNLRYSLPLPPLRYQNFSVTNDLTEISTPKYSNSHQALIDALVTVQLLIYLATQTKWDSFYSTAELTQNFFDQPTSSEILLHLDSWPKDLFVQRGKYQRVHKHIHNLWLSQEKYLCAKNDLIFNDFIKFIEHLAKPKLTEAISLESRSAILNWLCPLLNPLDLMGMARLLGLAT